MEFGFVKKCLQGSFYEAKEEKESYLTSENIIFGIGIFVGSYLVLSWLFSLISGEDKKEKKLDNKDQDETNIFVENSQNVVHRSGKH